MSEWVEPGPDFFDLVTGVRVSSWRWECQGEYREPDEREPWRRWRDGRPDNSFMHGWVKTIRSITEAGKRFERVRMVTEPPTDYLQWMFSFTHINIEAGEDIRWLAESRAHALELPMPEHDFYIIDDERVAILHFGENGVAGAEVLDDPETLAKHRQWRDLVWPMAVPHMESEYSSARSV
ncbi:hypothetical protein LY13_004274 [Prauserella aidingensis]|uniref:DUF6879 family protein n=1 Tax=Prauserella aidingensis TaxID=387890 RepID=UPI0020A3CA18|nr:DUF6879 family protein [Prauserella aidingensis]MCP2255498.1 hypothetical protein [Prauserella aidingensis]